MCSICLSSIEPSKCDLCVLHVFMGDLFFVHTSSPCRLQSYAFYSDCQVKPLGLSTIICYKYESGEHWCCSAMTAESYFVLLSKRRLNSLPTESWHTILTWQISGWVWYIYIYMKDHNLWRTQLTVPKPILLALTYWLPLLYIIAAHCSLLSTICIYSQPKQVWTNLHLLFIAFRTRRLFVN